MFLTIVVFIVILGLLIFVHELGHFMMAKWTGVKVDEFAFGFPPRLISKKYKGTRYSINAIPLGGYVKLFGEEEELKKSGSFFSKPVGIRIAIVVSGVIMNFILAIVLMTIGFSIGMTPLVSDPATMSGQKNPKVMVAYIAPDSPAQKAGITEGTVLEGFASASDLQSFTRSHLNQEVSIATEKNGIKGNVQLKLSTDTEAPLGVGVVSITKIKQPVWQAFITSFQETGKVISTLFVFLYDILKSLFTTGKTGPAGEGLSGPVGIFNFVGSAIKIGWIYVMQLVIILSINLGIINILPFPALDGGKILFLGLEGIFRRKVIRQEIENIIHLIGFALLILLIVAITYRDIVHLR